MLLVQKIRNNLSLPVGHALIGKRPGDRFLASYPRSGSTWLRTMLVNILVPGANSNPDVFNKRIPGVSITRVPIVRALAEPRIIHSHTYYRPEIKRVVYTVRDGRDVLVSFYHYLITRRGLDMPFERWYSLYENYQYGHRWDRNVESWLGSGRSALGDGMLVVNFEDMKQQPVEIIQRVCSHLDIDVARDVVEDAVEQASIEKARKIERERMAGQPEKANASFYRGGKSGQWCDYFTPEIEQRFWATGQKAMELAGYK